MSICKECGGRYGTISWKHLHYKHGMTIAEYDLKHGSELHSTTASSEESRRKYRKTMEGRVFVPWNKGLTKNTDERMLKISQGRTGENNPVHRIKDRELWKLHVKEGLQPFNEARKGKSLEELYGEERASLTKLNQSNAAKRRLVHGHTGKKHSPETIEKLREITAHRISTQRSFVSKPQKQLFEYLVGLEPERWLLEYQVGFYSIDIADPVGKFAIEVDGDYWHVNEAKGYTPIDKAQKRNLTNDKNKSSYLLTRKWKLVRIWVSDLEEAFEETIRKLRMFTNEQN